MLKLFSDPGALATLIAVPLTAFLTYIVTILVQIWSERHQQLQVTYSISTETASILAQSEINKNLRIAYEGKEVAGLRYFDIKIENSGKKNIEDFKFICEFEDSVQSVDSNFPQIVNMSPPDVHPDELLLDQTKSTSNKFYYTMKNFVVGQSTELKFLFANCRSDKEPLRFIEPQYKRQKGIVSSYPTLERNIQNALINLVFFYIILQIAPAIPSLLLTLGSIVAAIGVTEASHLIVSNDTTYLFAEIPSILSSFGTLIGIIIGLPFLLRALGSIRPIIPILARRLQEGLKN